MFSYDRPKFVQIGYCRTSIKHSSLAACKHRPWSHRPQKGDLSVTRAQPKRLTLALDLHKKHKAIHRPALLSRSLSSSTIPGDINTTRIPLASRSCETGNHYRISTKRKQQKARKAPESGLGTLSNSEFVCQAIGRNQPPTPSSPRQRPKACQDAPTTTHRPFIEVTVERVAFRQVRS